MIGVRLLPRPCLPGLTAKRKKGSESVDTAARLLEYVTAATLRGNYIGVATNGNHSDKSNRTLKASVSLRVLIISA